jgi:hypothetical protein
VDHVFQDGGNEVHSGIRRTYIASAAMWSLLLLAASALTDLVEASPSIEARQSAQTATVNLATTLGTPEHVASGFIYGIPDNYPNQIPSSW